MLSHCIIIFYKLWHGRLGLKGAGRLINIFSPMLVGLQRYPFRLPNGNVIDLDFREQSAFFWLNAMLGDKHQEDPLIRAICRVFRDGQVFWDVGANAGILSHEISRRVSAREHHYFEPNPKVFPWVSAALAHLKHSTGHQLALSNDRGTATFYVPRKGSAYGSLEHAGDACEIKVVKTTGDSLVFGEGMLPPDIIKIDTEGHEVDVLCGMKQLISTYRPIIFFEHIGISDDQVHSLIPPGYLLQTVSDLDGTLTESFCRSAGHNSVLIPSLIVT
jgi:FkbM family methyltransferase